MEAQAQDRRLQAQRVEVRSHVAMAVNVLRKRFGIHVTGRGVRDPLTSFSELRTLYRCPLYLVRNLAAAAYQEPTPIQRQAIPILLAGRDCVACAPTGTGKTLAFLIPIFMRLMAPAGEHVRAVVLSPTRELARQTFQQAKKLGAGRRFRVRIMTKATAQCIDFGSTLCDILVSTPLRLSNLLGAGVIKLDSVQFLVLDESDKLFELGFVEQIDAVIAACSNPGLSRSLFSATLLESVEELARTIMPDPIRVVIGERNLPAQNVEQKLQFVGSEEGKLLAIRQIFQEGLAPPLLVFVQSKDRARDLCKELAAGGMNVDAIHADRTQAQRDVVVDRFRSGELNVLIATDLMGRGMDFKAITSVVNYDIPQSTASYVHRVGRCGRAGRSGLAITLYTEEDVPYLRAIANVIHASGGIVPPWIMSLSKIRKRHKARDQLVVRRGHVGGAPAPFVEAKKRRLREMVAASKARKQRVADAVVKQG
eukprot:SM000007S20812  [mRNA]  locus=s7:350237:354445:- [translate_table: standard]